MLSNEKIFYIHEYNDKSIKNKQTRFNDKNVKVEEITYDYKGDKIKQINYDNNEKIKCIYKFNNKGLIAKEIIYDNKGLKTCKIIYNDEGLKTEENMYNLKGKKFKKIKYQNDGDIFYFYEYDNKNRRIQSTECKNNIEVKSVYEYNDKDQRIQEKWMLNNVGEIEEPVIERTYKFFGLNGLDQYQYKDKIPQDLPLYIREPFDNWFYTNEMPPYKDLGESPPFLNYFDISYIDILSNEDSKFEPSSFLKNNNYTVEMKYKGLKYLLEEDKDFYINDFKCNSQEVVTNQDRSFKETYYLHFNPAKNYITLYTEKFNTKENKK